MMASDFKFNIAGPGAEEIAKELADNIEKEFGRRPESLSAESSSLRGITRSIDPVALAAIIVAVPSAILATADLVARMKKKDKMDKLLDWLNDKKVNVTITSPDGTTIKLDAAGSKNILDAAL
jgi:hypothetical protein